MMVHVELGRPLNSGLYKMFLFKCRLLEERDITLYCDLHGHSRKHNVFIYGCENRFDPLKRLRERVFPVMISKNAPSKVTCM